MLQTEHPNGNPNGGGKTPIEREFEQSQTYKVIHNVGDKVVHGLNQAGITGDKVSHGINEAAKELNRAIGALNRSFNGRAAQNGAYRAPGRARSKTHRRGARAAMRSRIPTRRRSRIRRRAMRMRRRRPKRRRTRHTDRRARCRRPCARA